ncbi:hypothetical protein D1872_121710 [compost metagenome]
MRSSKTIPIEVDVLLKKYTQLVRSALPTQIHGIYVYGSVALQAYEPSKSDIDFLTLLRSRPTKNDIITITNIHKKLTSMNSLAKRMDGMYIPTEDLGKPNDEIPPYVHLASGKARQGFWDNNAVTWWTVKQYGISIHGPEASHLNIPVCWSDVVETMKYNLHTYWRKKSQSHWLYLIDDVMADAVCTLCRILYTLECQNIFPKQQSVYFALDIVSANWHPLLLEAIDIRKGKKLAFHLPSRWQRAKATQSFIHYMIDLCTQKHF